MLWDLKKLWGNFQLNFSGHFALVTIHYPTSNIWVHQRKFLCDLVFCPVSIVSSCPLKLLDYRNNNTEIIKFLYVCNFSVYVASSSNFSIFSSCVLLRLSRYKMYSYMYLCREIQNRNTPRERTQILQQRSTKVGHHQKAFVFYWSRIKKASRYE
jgi:hypothetical protein